MTSHLSTAIVSSVGNNADKEYHAQSLSPRQGDRRSTGLNSGRLYMSQTISPREASATVRLADQVIRAGAIYSMAEDRKEESTRKA